MKAANYFKFLTQNYSTLKLQSQNHFMKKFKSACKYLKL